MNLFQRLSMGVLRRAILGQAAGLDPGNRALVIQNLSDVAFTVSTSSRGRLHFYAPSQVLIGRASSMMSKEPDTIKWIDSFHRDEVLYRHRTRPGRVLRELRLEGVLCSNGSGYSSPARPKCLDLLAVDDRPFPKVTKVS